VEVLEVLSAAGARFDLLDERARVQELFEFC
jgi:hypothetical protein